MCNVLYFVFCRTNIPKPEIYHAKDSLLYTSEEKHNSTDTLDSVVNQHSPGKDSLLVKDETFPELAPRSSPEDDNESVCSCGPGPREGDAFPKAFERDLVTPTNIVLNGGRDSAPLTSNTPELVQNSSREAAFRDPGASGEPSSGDNVCQSFETSYANILSIGTENVPSAVPNISAQSNESAVVDKFYSVKNTAENVLKPSCYDSGIDIHDAGSFSGSDQVAQGGSATPCPSAQTVCEKARDSDSGTETVESKSDIVSSVEGESSDSARKKTSSVSFCMDSMQEKDGSLVKEEETSRMEEESKQETKKNKVT